MRIAINIVLVAASVLLVAVVLMQEGKGGMGAAITGQSSESFFGKNKNKTLQGRLKFITKIVAGLIAVLSVVLAIMSKSVG